MHYPLNAASGGEEFLSFIYVHDLSDFIVLSFLQLFIYDHNEVVGMWFPMTSPISLILHLICCFAVTIVQRFGKTTILSGWREGLGF